MKASLVSKKIKKQFLELKFLYADLDYYEEGLKEAQQEFQEAFYDRCEERGFEQHKRPEKNTAVTSSSTDIGTFIEEEEQENENNYNYSSYSNPPKEEEVEQVKEEKDEDLSKLYKKIASLTHPDTIPSNEKEELKQKRINQFIQAQEAYKNKNFYQMCQIALELGLEIPEPKKEHLKWLDKEAERIRKRIEHIKITYAWVWYNEEEENKNKVMDQYLSVVVN
jgi:hypothetical protein